MKLITLFFVIQGILLCQTIDPKFEKKLLEQFEKRNYKRCVDDGVKYLIENGSEELKRTILFAKRNLESYDSTKLAETDSLISSCINLLPDLIPKYAIYAGLAEVTYWMMYKENMPEKDWEKILGFSSEYFKKALDSTPKDSNLVLSQIYMNASEIFLHYGTEDYSNLIVRKAYKLNPAGYRVSLELSRIMEEEGKVDSSEIILTNLFNTFKYKSDYENVYEFIADNLMEKNNRISYYNKSLENGAKQKSKIYKQIGDLFYSSESIPYYEQGLKYDPKNEDLLIALGFQYNLKYEYEKSLSYYSKVKNWKSKSNFTTKFHCDIIGNMYYYQIEDYKKALEYYKLSNSHFSIALCFAKLKDYNKAIDQYQAEINSIEESFWGGEEDKKKYLANIHYNIGLSYAGLNKYQQAYDSFEYSYSLYELDETKFNKEEYKIASENLNWNIVTTSKNILYLIDPKRITKSGKRIKAWLKQVLFPYEKNIDATRVDYINDNKLDFDEYKNYQYSLLFLEVNCTNDQLRILKHIDYDNNGKIIINYDYDYTEFSDVIPESVGEYWLKYLCKKE